MKKIVGTIAAIALAATSAFAEVNVGMGFSRGFFTPFALSGGEPVMDISTSWGANPRIGGSISGAAEQVGVVADFKFDGGTVAVNDNAYLWLKPWNWLKIQIGQSFDDTLRGNACFGTWDWLRPGNILGEDLTFTRVCKNPLAGAWAPVEGAIVMVDPIEGLHLSAAFNTPKADNGEYAVRKASVVLDNLQVQAGYTIPGIVQIKAQYIGRDKDANYEVKPVINAAVSLKAVEGMTLDVGAFIDTKKDSDVAVAAFWGMGFDAFSVNLNGKVSIPTVDKGTTALAVGAGVGYDFGNGLSVGADVRYSGAFGDNLTDEAKKPALAFAAWLDKGVANGNIGIGVQGATRTDIRDFKHLDNKSEESFVLAIPVRVQCFF